MHNKYYLRQSLAIRSAYCCQLSGLSERLINLWSGRRTKWNKFMAAATISLGPSNRTRKKKTGANNTLKKNKLYISQSLTKYFFTFPSFFSLTVLKYMLAPKEKK